MRKVTIKLLKRFIFCYVVISLASFAWSYISDLSTSDVNVSGGWAAARRDSAQIAPDPLQFKNTAIVDVYAAKTYGWRGRFAVHTWIAFKRAGESRYTRYDVIGWRNTDLIRRNYALVDGYWFGAKPHILVEHRGPQAQAMIEKIEAAIKSYPYPRTYHAWPGPNSNTFIAHIGREVPELDLNMPANAIGKDYRPLNNPVGRPPSGKGIQFSLLGLIGVNLGEEEGVELNLLGVNLGLNVSPLQLRLPFIGNVPQSPTTEDRANQ